MRIEKSCPLPRTHNRLRQFHDLWHEAQMAYLDPDEFTTKLNACIQAGRSITFVLQKEHGKSEGFDAWYGPWQQRMRADQALRWLVNARNTIEKEGDLETHSEAVVSLAEGAYAEPLTTVSVPPFASPGDVAAAVRVKDLDEDARRNAVLIVERRWTVDDLPDAELLDTLGHCYGVLAAIVREAHARCGIQMQTFGGETHTGRHVRVEHPSGRLPCMVATAELRTAYWHLGAETLLELESRAVGQDDVAIQEAITRYGPAMSGHRLYPGMPNDEQVRAMHQMGRTLLKVDRSHTTLAMLHRGDEAVGLYRVEPEDRQSKVVMIRNLAAEVDRLGADVVIFASETWLARGLPPDDPKAKLRAGEREDREEGFSTYLLQRSGPNLMLLSRFSRNHDGSIEFSEPTESELGEPTIFEPILRVWRRWDREASGGES